MSKKVIAPLKVGDVVRLHREHCSTSRTKWKKNLEHVTMQIVALSTDHGAGVWWVKRTDGQPFHVDHEGVKRFHNTEAAFWEYYLELEPFLSACKEAIDDLPTS